MRFSSTMLAIYKERQVLSNAMNGGKQDDIKGKSLSYDRLGTCGWQILDGGLQGIPCTIYKGKSLWNFKTSMRNTARVDFHQAQLITTYYVGLDGVPLRSESRFTDDSDRDYKTIDIVAIYKRDSIDETITKDGVSTHIELHPSFGMERFAGMFEPLMRSGLIQQPEMDCAVLHPYTGVPYEFKLKVKSRFTGQYFFLPQAGYCIEILGDEGNGTAYLTRQGQLIQVTLPSNIDACLESGPLAEERNGWGTFHVTDWSRTTDETNPERPTYHTSVIPVLFNNPPVLYPVPCALTD